MQIFSLKNKTLEPIKQENFALEKHIQKLTEKNLEILFWLSFVETEFSIHHFRFDTIAFDTEINAFVIIEYKRGSSYSVVDQGLSYLAELLGNKADFILLLQEKTGKNFKKEDIDWSQTRVIFVAESFNIFQKNSINFRDLPIELWEIKKFQNNTICITQIKAKSQSESFKTLENKQSEKYFKNAENNIVNREIKTYTEEDHLKGKNTKIVELYERLKEKILEINSNIIINPQKLYIAFKKENRNFVDFVVQQNSIRIFINLKSWQFPIAEKTVRNVVNIGHYGNGDYEIRIKDDENIFEISHILHEAYKIFIQ